MVVSHQNDNRECILPVDNCCMRILSDGTGWYKSYSVNNEELDDHHRKLFTILNNLYDTCLQADNVDCVAPFIEEFVDYTNYHFAAEEKYMIDRGYEGIEEHKAQHRYFLDKLLELRNGGNKDDDEYKREVFVLLGNWVLKHVTVEDKKYSQKT